VSARRELKLICDRKGFASRNLEGEGLGSRNLLPGFDCSPIPRRLMLACEHLSEREKGNAWQAAEKLKTERGFGVRRLVAALQNHFSAAAGAKLLREKW